MTQSRRQEVAKNALIFDSFLNGDAAQRNFHRSVVKNGKKFLALIEADRIIFIPGHYAVASPRQLQSLHQKQTVPVSEVARELGIFCGRPLQAAEPLYREVDAHYLSYCALSGDAPSAHHQMRTYWLLRR